MVGKVAISVVSILLVVGVVIGVVVVVKTTDHHAASPASDDQHGTNGAMKMITTICEPTEYKDVCAKTLQSVAKNATATPQDYVLAIMQAALEELTKSLNATGAVTVDKDADQLNHMGVEDCKELLDDAISTLQASISFVGDNDLHTMNDRAHELLSWVTSVHALQSSCLDQIDNPGYKSAIEQGMVNATQLTHNAINVVAELDQLLKLFDLQSLAGNFSSSSSPSRRLLMSEDGYPTWFGATERKLLAAHGSGRVRPNVVVSKDGRGNFKTIKEALNAYPKNFKGRFVIYVKAGVYREQVLVDKTKPNIFIYGDGIGRTIVTESVNFGIQKVGTMNTATFGVNADGFIARSMTFRNDIGPKGHQAVAFRSNGDMTAMFDCSFEASQDTLYYQSKRQFYKNCAIYGTIDFIFGRGDCVIQDSLIVARLPLPNQFNTVTADGKEVERGSNGLVLQNCRIVPDNYLYPQRFKVPNYLGRPWGKFALTVTMQSEIGDFLRPEGYKIWDGANYHQTCEMYEFANRGPGAATNRRDRQFKRFRVLSRNEAVKYTAGAFISGQTWIPQTGVPYRLGL